MTDYYAESDSDLKVNPLSEAEWRGLFFHDIRRDRGKNRKDPVPRTDGEFAHRYAKLKIDICEWAFKYFSFPREERYELAKLREHDALVPYIDLIAAATGPNLVWGDIIETMTPRLVMGIVMKAIQLIIFGETLFGVSHQHNDALNAVDKMRIKSDEKCIPTSPLLPYLSSLPSPSCYNPTSPYFLLISILAPLPSIFKRQKIRASIINSFYPAHEDIPNQLQRNIIEIMTRIAFMLKPLLTDLGGRASRYAHSLAYLLADAARLHFDMRREEDTVYYVYSANPGDLVNDHTQCEVPPLPSYSKPEEGNPKQRIHIVLAPGIMALREFGHPALQKYQTRSIADVIAVTEWVNDDQINKVSKLSQII